jgi:hypothetical protein
LQSAFAPSSIAAPTSASSIRLNDAQLPPALITVWSRTIRSGRTSSHNATQIAPTAKTQAATTDVAPVTVSQQDKMRLCAKQASGKKGAERKSFMKTCLSAKKA